MENNIFRDVSTELDLNGPTLSFSSHPSDTTKNVGESVVLSGIATVSFGISGPENFGTLKYQWYKNGQALSDTTNISGSATNELTLSNLTSPGDSGEPSPRGPPRWEKESVAADFRMVRGCQSDSATYAGPGPR